MKKYLLFAAAALMLTACSNDENGTDNWAGEIRLTSGLTAQSVGTKAATAVQGAQFDKGEALSVYINENTTGTPTTTYAQPLAYTADGSGGLATANQPFFPTSGNGVNIYALYPASATPAAAFTVQADQSTDANYKKSDLMYGKPAQNPVNRTSSAVNIGFTHLLSKVTVVLESGDGNPNLAGAVVKLKQLKPTTTLTAGINGASVSEAAGDATDITVMTAAADALSGSAVVVPQTLAPSFIEVTLADGGVLTSSSLKDDAGNPFTSVVLTGSKEFKYTIKVNLTGLSVTSSISNWDDGGTTNGTATMQ